QSVRLCVAKKRLGRNRVPLRLRELNLEGSLAKPTLVNRHRPCVACARAPRSHEWRNVSKAGPFVALTPVLASTRRFPTIEPERQLRPLRVRLLPHGRPFRDSNV